MPLNIICLRPRRIDVTEFCIIAFYHQIVTDFSKVIVEIKSLRSHTTTTSKISVSCRTKIKQRTKIRKRSGRNGKNSQHQWKKKKSKKGTKIQRLSLKKGEKRKHGAARAQSLEVILSIIHAHCPHHIASIRTA